MSGSTLYTRRPLPSGRYVYEAIGHWPGEALPEGLWLVQVQPGCRRTTSLRKFADLPDPMPAAALERHRDVIATVILDLMSRREPISAHDAAGEIIAAVATREAAG
jgi:hypothetical protein